MELETCVSKNILIEDIETEASETSENKIEVIDYEYDYSEEEIEMIAYVMAHEVGNMDYTYKLTVAEIIRNRLHRDYENSFPDSISGILHQHNQFTAIDNYYNPEYYPDDEIYKAIDEVFYQHSDIINGAIYYRNPALSSRESDLFFSGREVVYSYSQTLWGVEYYSEYHL